MRLKTAMLYVKDFAAMKAFYSAVFGSAPVNTQWADTWAVFQTGGADFALHAIPAQYAQEIEISAPPEPREDSPMKLIFTVDNVHAERARLEAIGAFPIQRSWQQPGEACDVLDPEGNVFQISL
jgi:predicted enzyme related to lactoylglutathione lyase